MKHITPKLIWWIGWILICVALFPLTALCMLSSTDFPDFDTVMYALSLTGLIYGTVIGYNVTVDFH